MLIRTNSLNLEIDLDKNLFLFDIETTGLSSYHQVVMITFIRFKKEWELITLMAEGKDEEKDLLLAFNKELKEDQVLVHFNGKTFDIPFIKKRLSHHNMHSLFETLYHIDLLEFFPRKKLKVIEEQYGYKRKDAITGKEFVELYKDYKNHEDTLILHNQEDVLGMLHLIETNEELQSFLKVKYLDGSKLLKISLSEKTLRLRYHDRIIDFDLLRVPPYAFSLIHRDLPNEKRLLLTEETLHYTNLWHLLR